MSVVTRSAGALVSGAARSAADVGGSPVMYDGLHARIQAALGDAYQIEYELSGGAMSRVFVATEVALGRRVAVKVLPVLADPTDAVARFRREITVAARLHHPHIVPLHAAGATDDVLYYTMPLVDGESLRSRLARDGPLPLAVVRRVVREVGSALAFAHDAGVIHRDVKPENIYLESGTGRALLADFGIACCRREWNGLTQTGAAIGTPLYMSPEQVDGRAVDERADIYSLGVVSWEMLAGHLPWAGETLYTVIYNQKHESLPPIDDCRSDVSPAMASAIERSLAKDRDARWPSVVSFVEAMADGVASSETSLARQRLVRSSAAHAVAPFRPALVVDVPLAAAWLGSRVLDDVQRDRARRRWARPSLWGTGVTLCLAAAVGAATLGGRPGHWLDRVRGPDPPTSSAGQDPLGAVTTALIPPPVVTTPSIPSAVPAQIYAVAAGETVLPTRIGGAGPVRISRASLPTTDDRRPAFYRRAADAAQMTVGRAVNADAAGGRPGLTAADWGDTGATSASSLILATPRTGDSVFVRDTMSRGDAGTSGVASDTAGVQDIPAPVAGASPGADAASRGPADAIRTRASHAPAASLASPLATPLAAPLAVRVSRPSSAADRAAVGPCPVQPAAAADVPACLPGRSSAAIDRELNRVFVRLIQVLHWMGGPQQGDGAPQVVTQLRAEQRAWYVARDTECRRFAFGPDRTWQPSAQALCLDSASVRRTTLLAAALRRAEAQ